jgi:hypothetical protein
MSLSCTTLSNKSGSLAGQKIGPQHSRCSQLPNVSEFDLGTGGKEGDAEDDVCRWNQGEVPRATLSAWPTSPGMFPTLHEPSPFSSENPTSTCPHTRMGICAVATFSGGLHVDSAAPPFDIPFWSHSDVAVIPSGARILETRDE